MRRGSHDEYALKTFNSKFANHHSHHSEQGPVSFIESITLLHCNVVLCRVTSRSSFVLRFGDIRPEFPGKKRLKWLTGMIFERLARVLIMPICVRLNRVLSQLRRIPARDRSVAVEAAGIILRHCLPLISTSTSSLVAPDSKSPSCSYIYIFIIWYSGSLC